MVLLYKYLRSIEQQNCLRGNRKLLAVSLKAFTYVVERDFQVIRIVIAMADTYIFKSSANSLQITKFRTTFPKSKTNILKGFNMRTESQKSLKAHATESQERSLFLLQRFFRFFQFERQCYVVYG